MYGLNGRFATTVFTPEFDRTMALLVACPEWGIARLRMLRFCLISPSLLVLPRSNCLIGVNVIVAF